MESKMVKYICEREEIQKKQACGEQIAMLYSRELLGRNSRKIHKRDKFFSETKIQTLLKGTVQPSVKVII